MPFLAGHLGPFISHLPNKRLPPLQCFIPSHQLYVPSHSHHKYNDRVNELWGRQLSSLIVVSGHSVHASDLPGHPARDSLRLLEFRSSAFLEEIRHWLGVDEGQNLLVVSVQQIANEGRS